jgi:prepilin-type N-terminal cleavage/methylation domain-containing protein/prepilin-type processing-associated H-X9-DG protein
MKIFTLIELLVVVAIIGILASLLLPVLGKSRQAAQRTVCVSQSKQISLAYAMYTDDNNDYNPTIGNITQPWETQPESWAYQLSQMANNNKSMFKCPTTNVDGWKPPTGTQKPCTYSYNQLLTHNLGVYTRNNVVRPSGIVLTWEYGYLTHTAQAKNYWIGTGFPESGADWDPPHAKNTYIMSFVDGHVERLNASYVEQNKVELCDPTE